MGILIRYILVFFLLFVVSCQKEKIDTKDDITINDDQEQRLSIIGEWVITGGDIYIHNLDNGKKEKYSHFSNNKTISNLRYGEELYGIEKIVKDETTWLFREYSENYLEFVLNGDEYNTYNVTSTKTSFHHTYSIIEKQNETKQLLGGSAKPFIIYSIDYDNEVIRIKIHNADYNQDGYNNNYYSILELTKI